MKTSDLNEEKVKSDVPKEATVNVREAAKALGNKIGDLEITNVLALSEKASAMKLHLAEQPLESIVINRIKGESENFKFEGSINGLKFAAPKGKRVQLPRQIVEMIYESQQVDYETTSGHSKNMQNQSDEAVKALS